MTVYAFSGRVKGPRATLRDRSVRFYLDAHRQHEYRGVTTVPERTVRAFRVATDLDGTWGPVYAEVPYLYVGAETLRGGTPLTVTLTDGDPVDSELYGSGAPSPIGDVDVITVTGKYLDFTGTPMVGVVTFTGTTTVTDPAGGLMLVPETLTATLDGTGSFTINLPATDTPNTSPIGWTYSVVEVFIGNPNGRSYSISVPHSSSGGTVSLAALEPVDESGGVWSVPTSFAAFTTSARNALNVAAGATVFDTTLGYLVTFDGVEWKDQAGMTA